MLARAARTGEYPEPVREPGPPPQFLRNLRQGAAHPMAAGNGRGEEARGPNGRTTPSP